MKERIFSSLYGDGFNKFGSLHLERLAERQRNVAQVLRRFEREWYLTSEWLYCLNDIVKGNRSLAEI